MTKAIGLIVIGVVVGVLVAVFYPGRKAVDVAVSTPTSSSAPAANGDVEVRLLALENQLTEEIGRRNELENVVSSLLDTEQQPARPEASDAPVLQRLEALQDPAVRAERQAQLRERFQRFNGQEARTSRLERSGFSPEQASWIVDREEEMRLETLYDDWQQRREQTLQRTSNKQSVTDKMKAELGIDGYERYLEATGRPTKIGVGQVIDNSPAAKAGFKPGDQIVSYNGERVFNVGELNNATVQGELGEPVVVGVVRDGEQIQLSMERGPLGITSMPSFNGRRVGVLRGQEVIRIPARERGDGN